MSEYVEIRTSVTDILGAATNLVTMGGQLDTDMTGLVDQIRGHENAGTWGGDEFATTFLKGYHKPTGSTTAADAVKDLGQGKNSLGSTTQNLGNMVVNAMINYSDTDSGNASDIGSLA